MDKPGVVIGEKPVVSMDVVDDKIRLTWKTSLLKRTLDHEISKCVGCSLCLPCPWDAITLGPVQETASGRIEGAPLVNVDPDACTFCGLCDSSCIFGAFDAKYEGEGAVNEFVRISGTHEIDEEKCAPCLLCAKVCPTDSLSVEVKVDHKKDLVIYKGEEHAEGTIRIDEDKCSYCGLCELLCPEAIKIFWSDDKAKPPDFKPAVGIRVDLDNCDYCGLCQDICPDDAIGVNCTESSAREIKQPTISGKLTHNDETCVKCGLCATVCPYEALKVEKPFTGEVKTPRLEKCDPTGCNNCFNICPVDAIYPTGTADKIEVLDHCVYCGACEHSCPYDVLEVQREGYILDELECEREWERARRLFFDAVVGKEAPPSGLFEREISVEPIERVQAKASAIEGWDTEDGQRLSAMMSAKQLRDLMKKNPRLHLQFERGNTAKVVKKIKDSQKAHQEE
jgi:4Fe-4S ferredoxin